MGWHGRGLGWGAPHTSQGPAKRSQLFCAFPAEHTYTQQQGVVRQGREAGSQALNSPMSWGLINAGSCDHSWHPREGSPLRDNLVSQGTHWEPQVMA